MYDLKVLEAYKNLFHSFDYTISGKNLIFYDIRHRINYHVQRDKANKRIAIKVVCDLFKLIISLVFGKLDLEIAGDLHIAADNIFKIFILIPP